VRVAEGTARLPPWWFVVTAWYVQRWIFRPLIGPAENTCSL